MPVLLGLVPLEQLVEAGRARLEGDPAVLGRLMSLLVEFDPAFEIMPGTKAAAD